MTSRSVSTSKMQTEEALADDGVSIVVPVYNVAPYLTKCVTSLLEQDYPDVEVILVDDGSTDGSGSLCDAIAAENPRVRVIHQSNQGLSGARNTGLASASGAFVAFIDADDWADPTAVSCLHRAAKEHAADIVVAGYQVDSVDRQGNLIESRHASPTLEVTGPGVGCDQVSASLINTLGYAWNKLYRRALLVEYNLTFIQGLSLVEDAVFNGEALRRARRVVLLDETPIHYVQRSATTLGTRYYEDHAALRLRAISDLIAVLSYWGVPDTQTGALRLSLQLEAIYAALMMGVGTVDDSRERLTRVRMTLQDPRVRATLVAGQQDSRLSPRLRVFALMLRVVPSRLIAWALVLRQTRRRHHAGADD